VVKTRNFSDTRMNTMSADRRRQIQDAVVRLQQAYLDTPALRLTLPDAQRRCAADAQTCEAVLNVLVDAGVLARTREGQYARRFPLLASRVAA
jgi:hypothetical protein